MFIIRRVFIFCFLLFCFSYSARANFDFNANCIAAYTNILNLKLNAARTLIAAEKKNNPQNAIPYLLDNYVDYFDLMTSESKSDFDRLEKNKSARISRVEKENSNSPYYNYSLAEINLQWALIRSAYGEYNSAGFEIKRAYSLLQENAKKFPTFLPNQKGLGMINALLGSLPGGLKGVLGFFGIKGTTENGIKMLENLLVALPKSPYSHFYDESVFYLAYIQIDILNDRSLYDKIIKNTAAMEQGSPLKAYVRGYAAVKMAHTADAVSALDNLSSSTYQAYPYLLYLLGVANVHKLDKQASEYLLNYLKINRGVNHIKDTYLNLAWLALLNGDVSGYNNYVTLVKTKGYTYHYKDKQALNEIAYGVPDTNLLRARLLFDGGYYTQALNILDDKKTDNFKNTHDKIEFYYRMGRIYEALGKDDTSIKLYQAAIALGKNEKYYFAATAAVNIGVLYENKKNYPQARSYYNTAIGMKNHDFENSIESRAKEGLRRIGN